jgi:glycosyltransferase involved in cell wall biosynthesis
MKCYFSESSPNIGGQEMQLLAQAAALSTRSVQTALLCRPGGRLAQLAGERGIEVIPVPFGNSLHLPSILKLLHIFRTRRPDVIICHSGHDTNNVAFAARLTPHRPRLVRSRTYQHGKPKSWTYNHFVDLTLTPSEHLRQCLLTNRKILPERIRVLHPGIDFALLDARANEPLPQAASDLLSVCAHDNIVTPLIAHVAMLRPEKGHLLMLEVMDRLRTRGIGARYAIAGEGAMENSIRARITELRLDNEAIVLGRLANPAALIARADILVMPSSYEPLGMAQIEALALGIPVIGSRVGGIPETIHDDFTGWLAQSDDPHDWANKLASALGDLAAMRAMARRGRSDVRNRFDIHRHIDGLLGHITRLN